MAGGAERMTSGSSRRHTFPDCAKTIRRSTITATAIREISSSGYMTNPPPLMNCCNSEHDYFPFLIDAGAWLHPLHTFEHQKWA